MEIQVSNNNKSVSDDFLVALELTYINNHYLESIEKKFNKLINIETEPRIDVIIIQYFLVILGGDYINVGLLTELQNYIAKLESNIKYLDDNKLNFNHDISLLNRYKRLYEITNDNQKKAIKLNSNMSKVYKNNLSLSKSEKYSRLYHLYDLHQIQKETMAISKNNTSFTDHFKKINLYLDKMNEISDNLESQLTTQKENLDDNIYKKFIDSQISVLEQQLEIYK